MLAQRRGLASRAFGARSNTRAAPKMSLRAAPKTGQHTAAAPIVEEALSKFFDDSVQCTVTPTSGGVNNVVQYIDTSAGDRYILRIYNNGNKSEKVVFEHEILRQLKDQKLSFRVPSTLPSKQGRSHELLSSGAECCIFQMIPGTLAKTTSPVEVGRATGELCTAMSKVCIDMEPPIAPYYDLFRVHHAIGGNSQLFYDEVARNPDFNACRESIDFLVSEIRRIEPKLSQYKEGLPMQLVHGDLHYDNVMVVDETVAGLLDFEFATFDTRIMELAVALSKYVGEADPLPLCESFISGYVQHGQLTDAEIDVLPDMINLRIFSNAVYFTSRAIAGEDSLESLTSRADAYAKRVRWVNANADAIRSVVRNKIRALAKA